MSTSNNNTSNNSSSVDAVAIQQLTNVLKDLKSALISQNFQDSNGNVLQDDEIKKLAQTTNAAVQIYEAELKKLRMSAQKSIQDITQEFVDNLDFAKNRIQEKYAILEQSNKKSDQRLAALAKKIENKNAEKEHDATKVGRKNAQQAIANKENAIMAVAKQVVDGATQAVNAWVDLRIAMQKNELQHTKNVFDKEQKLWQAHMSMSNIVASNVVTSINSMATQTALAASRTMASGAMSEANEAVKLMQSKEMAEREFNVAERERIQAKRDAIAKSVNGFAGGAASIAGMFGPIGQLVSGVIQTASGIVNTAAETQKKFIEFDIEKSKQKNEFYNTMMDRVSQITDKMKNIVSQLDNTANAISDKLIANENIYRQTGVAMGYGGAEYLGYMQKLQEQASKTFNITAEQMKQMTEGYAGTSGRTILMTGDNYDQMTAMSKAFGVGQSEIASNLGDMHIFNTSISDSYNIMNDMYKVATKMGLSTSKFSKDLANNLKLAQKYNFKGGVENMAKLTLWAEKTRFNIQNATTFADKMMSNNISDVLETSAKLQVLGGAASMFSDPMAMMWEAGNDVGALAKRQAAMFADITGTFDKKTGETTFSEFDLRMIKARAEAMGMNYEDVLSQKRQSNKQGVINKQLAGYGLDEDTLNGIGQRTLYKKGVGFVVNTMQGEKTIQEVANMSDSERNRILLPDNEKDAIMEIAKDARSLTEISEAQLAYLQATTTPELWDSIVRATNISMESQKTMLTSKQYKELMQTSITEQANIAKEQAESAMRFMTENTSAVTDYYNFVKENTGKQNVFQVAELALLKKMAEHNGVENVSNLFSKISKIAVAKPGDERQRAIDNAHFSAETQELASSMLGISVSTNDAIGNTNGGIISGASNVKPINSVTKINDGSGTLVKTHANDQFLAAKSGGPIDKLFDIVQNIINNQLSPNTSTSNNNVSLNLSGDINLRENGTQVNFVELLKRDPAQLREMTRLILKSMDMMSNGKVSKKHYI